MRTGHSGSLNTGKPAGSPWQHSRGLSALTQLLFEVPCLRMKVNSRGSPSEKGHHKSCIMWRCKDFVSHTVWCHLAYYCYHQLGWKNWNLPPQLSLPLFVSKISTPGIPQLLSQNKELLLWLKGWSVPTASTCGHGWQMAHVKNSLEINVWPVPRRLHRWILWTMQSSVKASGDCCPKRSLLRSHYLWILPFNGKEPALLMVTSLPPWTIPWGRPQTMIWSNVKSWGMLVAHGEDIRCHIYIYSSISNS